MELLSCASRYILCCAVHAVPDRILIGPRAATPQTSESCPTVSGLSSRPSTGTFSHMPLLAHLGYYYIAARKLGAPGI